MKNILKSFFLIVGIALMAICSSTMQIQKNMGSNSYSMAYIMDSKIAGSKNGLSVRVDSILFNPGIMSDTVKVSKKKGMFLPLIIINIWDWQYNCIQGKSMIEEDIPSFLKASLIREINRSGSFSVDTSGNSGYSLELSIDEMKTEGPYQNSGIVFIGEYFYGFFFVDRAGPAISNLTVSYKLKKGNQIVYSNSSCSEKWNDQINKSYSKIKIFQQDYAVSMVEAMAYNFKNAIELIVHDLNTYFDSQHE